MLAQVAILRIQVKASAADHTLVVALADAWVITQGTQISIVVKDAAMATALADALVAAKALKVGSSMGALRIPWCSLSSSVS